ncbi:MAG: Asp-tRNA(Asn)/Glu-tRNA(Gln) amidotransferase subunit GatC [bacterium]|nr:Asp-tRNA(Asn)/Glu-tRNA(Gln) amidotransferase subunit GatC [bacterium]
MLEVEILRLSPQNDGKGIDYYLRFLYLNYDISNISMITKEQIQRVASLARLSLKEDEVEKMTKELGNVLDYFSVLEQSQTDSHDTVSPQGILSGRKDVAIEQTAERRAALLSSLSLESDAICVPQVFEARHDH